MLSELFAWKSNPFSVALAISVFFHVVLIVTEFAIPSRPNIDRPPILDVVLVNAKTKSKPTKADALAQANLDRGGNTDDDRQMKSVLPSVKHKIKENSVKQAAESKKTEKAAKAQIESAPKKRAQDSSDKQAYEVMTKAQSKTMVETQPTQQATAPQQDKEPQQLQTKTLSAADLLASSLETARQLEAQIAKQDEEYQKRPRRKELGARTQEYRFASYVEAWRQKVEKIGNLNYPEEAKAKNLHGQLELSVDIRADGSIENMVVTRSSGFKVLDDAARRIVELAAPFAPFPEDIRKEFEIVGITRTWTFTKEDSFATK